MIITIARECGCYGDLIGEKLGEKLGIPVYDKKSVTQMAKEAEFIANIQISFRRNRQMSFLLQLYRMSVRQ